MMIEEFLILGTIFIVILAISYYMIIGMEFDALVRKYGTTKKAFIIILLPFGVIFLKIINEYNKIEK